MEMGYEIPIFEIRNELLNKPRDNGKNIVYIEKKGNNKSPNNNKKEKNNKNHNKITYDKK
jgi:hypothetical protein